MVPFSMTVWLVLAGEKLDILYFGVHFQFHKKLLVLYKGV